jgi:uncharacterized protein (TIGR03435 family)
MGFGWGPKVMRSKGASMRDLGEKLAEGLQRPVLDRTGLSGLYEIDLKFAPIAPDPSIMEPNLPFLMPCENN